MRKSNETIICADGFSMSVQASASSYCEPRINDAQKYTQVEVGFPNTYEPLLVPWVEDPENYTGTVYGYVPVQVIVDVCAKHGGIVSGDLPNGIPHLRGNVAE